MQSAREIKVSGRMVLITLVTFFVVIATVNAVMATLAIRTFGGVEAENPYRAGLEFAREINAARAQQARNLQVDVVTSRIENGKTRFKLTMKNTDPSVASQLEARLELRHPADKRHDQTITLKREADGVFIGDIIVEPGQWNARVSIDRGGERFFRSLNRVTIP